MNNGVLWEILWMLEIICVAGISLIGWHTSADLLGVSCSSPTLKWQGIKQAPEFADFV